MNYTIICTDDGISVFSNGEGKWSIFDGEGHVEYQTDTASINQGVDTDFGPIDGGVHQGSSEVVQDDEFLPPKALRTDDEIVYTKQ